MYSLILFLKCMSILLSSVLITSTSVLIQLNTEQIGLVLLGFLPLEDFGYFFSKKLAHNK
ncbi:hypothetical protein EDC96DRAFT_516882 [Choanephora cucurbitarum]|nr:hypothetical protein EDC96DRAFT_516882 [Choanephora cucurbitarum]